VGIADPVKLAAAMQKYFIIDNARYENERRIEPDRFFVVDISTEEPEVNWPGDLVSEHASLEEARVGLARALIEASK